MQAERYRRPAPRSMPLGTSRLRLGRRPLLQIEQVVEPVREGPRRCGRLGWRWYGRRRGDRPAVRIGAHERVGSQLWTQRSRYLRDLLGDRGGALP
eukprot:2861521-Prymnesium_polylepis.1